MDDVRIFSDTKIRDIWYDVHGFLRTIVPAKKVGSGKKRGKSVFAAVASVLVAASIASSAIAASVPTQLMLQWPAPPTAALTKQSLADALHQLRRTGADWNGAKLSEPDSKALVAAEKILPQLPNFVAEASAGVDGDGNVYFRLRQGPKLAYLTVAPRTMYLLVMQSGKESIYIDDEPFKKLLPARIKRILEDNLAA